MKTYQEMVSEYRRRQHDTVVDTITAGLASAEQVAVDSGLLEATGIMAELTGTVSSALPFVIIAVTEGAGVILGRKPGSTAGHDTAWRMAKTGAALGIGTAAAAFGGLWAAIPASMGVRALFDTCKLKALTNTRVNERTNRLRALNRMIRKPAFRSGTIAEEEADALPADDPQADALPVDGSIR